MSSAFACPDEATIKSHIKTNLKAILSALQSNPDLLQGPIKEITIKGVDGKLECDKNNNGVCFKITAPSDEKKGFIEMLFSPGIHKEYKLKLVNDGSRKPFGGLRKVLENINNSTDFDINIDCSSKTATIVGGRSNRNRKYEKRTKQELIQTAAKRGIKASSKMRKDAIIAMLRKK